MEYPTITQLHSILKQMKEKGIRYEDYESEYFDGEHRTYYFDTKKQEFIFVRMDVITASYFDKRIISQETMQDALSKYSIYDLRESGFNL